jgi:hypothetical protein
VTKYNYIKTVIKIIFLILISYNSYADSADPTKIVDGEFLLKYMPGTKEIEKKEFEKRNGLILIKNLPLADVFHYKSVGCDPYIIVEELKKSAIVYYAEPVYIRPRFFER